MRGKRGKERKNGGLGYIPPNWRHGADHARTIDSNQDLAATVAWNAIRDCTLKANRHYSQSIWKLRPESTSRRFVARLFNVFTYFYTKVSLDRHDCLNNGRWQIIFTQPASVFGKESKVSSTQEWGDFKGMGFQSWTEQVGILCNHPSIPSSRLKACRPPAAKVMSSPPPRKTQTWTAQHPPRPRCPATLRRPCLTILSNQTCHPSQMAV